MRGQLALWSGARRGPRAASGTGMTIVRRRQARRRGEHRADQRLGPGDHLGRPGDQRQQQQARLELAGHVPELADLPAVQRAAGGVGQHRAVAERGAGFAGPQHQPPERPVLGLAQAGHRAGQPDQPACPGVRRAGAGPRCARRSSSRASGVPSGSASTTLAASAGTASRATSRVTGIGQGVPSASVPVLDDRGRRPPRP